MDANSDLDPLIKALRNMPQPEPRPGFVDKALAEAARRNSAVPATSRARVVRHVATRWETWVGVAMGAVAAAALTIYLLLPAGPGDPESGITLALNEIRSIDVLIESERDLADATIRIDVTGGVALDGFENEHGLYWRADLVRGGNVISLPVVARNAGAGRLVAVIEHEGKTRRVTIDVTVKGAGSSPS
jgi:hypothetical protein